MKRNTVSTASILCSRPISTFPTPSGCRSAARAATTSPVSSTGQNHCIRGMKIGTQETPADYVSAGLFACIDGAVVRNLAVADAEILRRAFPGCRAHLCRHHRRCHRQQRDRRRCRHQQLRRLRHRSTTSPFDWSPERRHHGLLLQQY